MVNENTTVKELFEKGYKIISDDQTAVVRHLTDKKCPECSALLDEIQYDGLYCTECDYESKE